MEIKRNQEYFDVIWENAVILADSAKIEIPVTTATVNDASRRRGNVPQYLNNFVVTTTVGN